MNHRNLGRGAIACSAVVVTQWIPSFGVQLPANVCQKETDPEPAHSAADAAQTARSQKCAPNGILSLLESLPEQFKLQWSHSSARLPGSIERKYQQLIEQAQTLAGENRVAEAIVMMNAIPKNSRHFNVAYQLQETWSQETLHEATSHYQQANLATALKLLEAIPATSSQHSQVNRLKQKWQQDAAQMQRAIAASRAGAWQEVIAQLEAFKDTPLFQSLPVQELLQLALLKVLEPDPALLQIASTMDSSSLSAASLPAPPPAPMSSASLAVPPSPRSTAAKIDLGLTLAPATTPPLTTKLTKPTRQAAPSPSAPANQDRSAANAHEFSLSPSIAAAVDNLRRAIAEPEIMLQK